MTAHTGPIFSMQWLPLVTEATDSSAARIYALVTGSTDRAVRIWRVNCSTKEGLVVTPMLVLDTLTTHILSLSSFLDEDVTTDRDKRLQNVHTAQRVVGLDSLKRGTSVSAVVDYSSSNKIDNDSRRRTIGREKNLAKKTYEREQHTFSSTTTAATTSASSTPNILNMPLPSPIEDEEITYRALIGPSKNSTRRVFEHSNFALVPTTLYLAAGTNLGAIYVWKMEYDSFLNLMGRGYLNPRGGGNQDILLDDGRRLHSLLQSSDRPIIHLSLSSAIDTTRFEDSPRFSTTAEIDVSVSSVNINELLKKRSARNKRFVFLYSHQTKCD